MQIIAVGDHAKGLLLKQISPERFLVPPRIFFDLGISGIELALKKDLSKREYEVLRLLAEGKGNRQVAEQLGISVRTVEGHRARIMLKLELASLSELIRYAVRKKIIDV
jgi:DNA-binding NarL/FixJ family response regulator